MKLHRLRIANFAVIGNVDVELCQGLNVLYGPNDLGKSTVAAAIRLGLLLPHTSTHCDQYVGWTGADDPVVEITFQTEEQRIWRVRKHFGKSGSSHLQESRNGHDFDDVERGRKVDARLREILRWGIPEPGGTGSAKGLPTSFLATALLSPQDDVGAVLRDSLQGDPTGSGKEQIAAALQAVAQDPLFVALLRSTQVRRDEAYTDKGAKKTARGSVFKAAAERLNEARNEKERLQRIVADSEGAERQLRELTNRRSQRQEGLAVATALLADLSRLVSEASNLSFAAEQVQRAQGEVLRIQRIGTEVAGTERKVAELTGQTADAEQALRIAREQQAQSASTLDIAEETARAEGTDPAMSNMMVRQQLDLRWSAAEHAARDAQQRIDACLLAQKLAEAATSAGRELQNHEASAATAVESATKTGATLQTAEAELQKCDLLERALDVYAADKQVVEAELAVATNVSLQSRLDAAAGERARLSELRSAMTVPTSGAMAPMRRLANELAAARGALDVGLVVTVRPNGPRSLRVRKDGQQADSTPITRPIEIEAQAEVEVAIDDVATVNIRGGRREAQKKAQTLETRWEEEVMPHLLAAGVTDLDGLDAKVTASSDLDANLRAKDTEMDSLRGQIASLGATAESVRGAKDWAATCRAALGDVPLEALAADVDSLGSDPKAGLRKRRQDLSNAVEVTRVAASSADHARTLANERTRQARLALEEAVQSRDKALTAFPEGVAGALAAAKTALASSNAEKERIAAEFASLDQVIEARQKSLDAALKEARTNVAEATSKVEAAQGGLTALITERASQEGRLDELRKSRDAENLGEAEARLSEATDHHASLPVPDRAVADYDLIAAQNEVAVLRTELEGIERDIQRAHGALEQVGGAVARERLRDATEAFELAERQEKEIEAEYEAWKLLLEQMKEADAAQAGNLGQALAPGVAGRFQELTQQRYDTVQLTAQLATEGVVISGVVRPTTQISVGTREQLSTLYRLSLAEYLDTAIVLDDQLVQSDESRMGWFRALLTEKARIFQIVVLTCRPGDYLSATAMVPDGSATYADTDGGFVRAVDLGKVVQRR